MNLLELDPEVLPVEYREIDLRYKILKDELRPFRKKASSKEA